MSNHFDDKILESLRELRRELHKVSESQEKEFALIHKILSALLKEQSKVTGGTISRTEDTSMLSISPGNSPQFLVTPTFSGTAFSLLAASASVTSSDTTNFPVTLNTEDPQGTLFTAAIPAGATVPTGSEQITITWTYRNVDGSVATVTAVVTETGLSTQSNVVGGTINQVV